MSPSIKDYASYVERVKQGILNSGRNEYSQPIDIAKTIWRAATDHSPRLHYPVGNANIALALRRWLPATWFPRLMQGPNQT